MQNVDTKTRRKTSVLFEMFESMAKEHKGLNLICEEMDITTGQFANYLCKASMRDRCFVKKWAPNYDEIKVGNLHQSFIFMLSDGDDVIDENNIVKITKTGQHSLSMEIMVDDNQNSVQEK